MADMRRERLDGNPGVSVHKGVLELYKRVESDLKERIKNLKDGSSVALTGHCLGAAVACVAYCKLSKEFSDIKFSLMQVAPVIPVLNTPLPANDSVKAIWLKDDFWRRSPVHFLMKWIFSGAVKEGKEIVWDAPSVSWWNTHRLSRYIKRALKQRDTGDLKDLLASR